MCYFVCDTIQGTFCSYFMETTSIVYIYRHFCTWEFLITYILTFACVILFVIPFKVHFVHILWRLRQLYTFTGIFVQPLRIGYIIIGLYWAARKTRQFQAPMPKAQDNKPEKDQQQPLAVPPPKDVYLDEKQA